MKEAEPAAGGSRLPWLSNDGEPSGTRNLGGIAGWLVAGALVVFGGAYWFTTHGTHQTPAEVTPAQPTTAVIPQTGTPAKPQASKPKTPAAHAPQVSRPVSHPAPVVSRSEQVAHARPRTVVAHPSAPAAEAKAQPQPKAQPQTQKQTRVASQTSRPAERPQVVAHEAPVFPVIGTGVARLGMFPRPGTGPVVQLGAFTDLNRAKLAWRAMEHAYPPLKQFHASIIQNRDWNGHAFYQFAVGTASQADSEMLCQSMQRRNFRCSLVASPWRPLAGQR